MKQSDEYYMRNHLRNYQIVYWKVVFFDIYLKIYIPLKFEVIF